MAFLASPGDDVRAMRRMSALALLAVASGLAVSASAAVPRSGLYGTVRRGPIAPVCQVGVPCDAPAPGITLTFSKAGLVRKTRTDARGAYRILLPPGIYAVRTSARPFGETPRPRRVHVRVGHIDRLVFAIDTGIR